MSLPFPFPTLSLSYYCHSFFKNLCSWLASCLWKHMRVLPVISQKKSLSGRPCMINMVLVGSGRRYWRGWSCKQAFAGPNPLSSEWRKHCQNNLFGTDVLQLCFLRFCWSSSLQWLIIKCAFFPLPQVLKVWKFLFVVKNCVSEKLVKRLVRFKRATV